MIPPPSNYPSLLMKENSNMNLPSWLIILPIYLWVCSVQTLCTKTCLLPLATTPDLQYEFGIGKGENGW